MMIVREHFDRDLRHLQDEVIRMGSEVEENLVTAVAALRARDLKQSQTIIAADRQINDLQITLNMDALTLIATQQPAAKDLRLIAAVMNIANELERIHDYAKGIGRISVMMNSEPLPISLTDEFPAMAETTRTMLHRALDAFINRDETLARAIAAEDDIVDELFNIALKKMTDAFVQNLTSYEDINRLGWANHNLERAADRVCNICEWVGYMITGKFEEYT
ncbi:MAG: phosphate signaling complex protein PhoU [Anaerolineae bacterium]|nr:phosphate signaling complex protein PhoU [Anaerolineae bacterium]